MPALYFGSSDAPLFGFIEAARGRPRKSAVLLVHPGIHEYMRAHWAFRSLASQLADKGFSVLRFDPRGVGDSSGEPEAATFETCVDDACAAAVELRDASGASKLVLIGMRLGAAIAARAAERLPFAHRVLLWNPVVSGRSYLAEIEEMDQAMRLRLLHPWSAPAGELAGYRFPAEARRSIERIDLRTASPALHEGSAGEKQRRPSYEIFTQLDSNETRELGEALGRAGHSVRASTIPDSGEPARFPDAALLAQGAIAELVARLDESER